MQKGDAVTRDQWSCAGCPWVSLGLLSAAIGFSVEELHSLGSRQWQSWELQIILELEGDDSPGFHGKGSLGRVPSG